jgi:aminoglycoside 3-N-acetyltransferase I
VTTRAAVTIRRLGTDDVPLARDTFALMARVFEEPSATLGHDYLHALLSSSAFWAMAALVGGVPVGGLTAHAIPLTRIVERELFIYDLAVAEEWQRRGVGRALMDAVRRAAREEGMSTSFVPADNDDSHALAFYRALGGSPAEVTIFSFD